MTDSILGRTGSLPVFSHCGCMSGTLSRIHHALCLFISISLTARTDKNKVLEHEILIIVCGMSRCGVTRHQVWKAKINIKKQHIKQQYTQAVTVYVRTAKGWKRRTARQQSGFEIFSKAFAIKHHYLLCSIDVLSMSQLLVHLWHW